jgi:hypothetical protein
VVREDEDEVVSATKPSFSQLPQMYQVDEVSVDVDMDVDVEEIGAIEVVDEVLEATE